MIGNSILCADPSRYRITVLCGGWQRARSGGVWRYGGHAWYSLWHLTVGTVTLVTADGSRRRVSAPAAILYDPTRCRRLDVPVGAKVAWCEFDVSQRPLVVRGRSKGRKPADAVMPPGAAAVWGVAVPLVLLGPAAVAAQACLLVVNAQWWRGALGAVRADARLALWLSETAADSADAATQQSEPAAPAATADAWLVHAQACAVEGLPRGWNVATWAAALGLSRQHFTRRFRAATGVAPTLWLARERRDRALALLAQGRRSVAAVATACGFTSAVVFARFCRRHTGRLPSAWRAQR